MTKQEHGPIWRRAWWAMGMLVGFVTAFAWGEDRPSRLLVVGTPMGSDAVAQMAKSLLPTEIQRTIFVPVSSVQLNIEQDMDVDGGADAGGVDAGIEETSAVAETAEKAREAALAFDLVLAAELWRRAADALMASEAVVLSSRDVASTLMEAGAASCAAGEQDLALQYFRHAIAVDGQVVPGPAISPDAKSLFNDAKTKGPLAFDIPRDSVLGQVCEKTETDGIVWVSMSKDGAEWVISFKLFLNGEVASEMETRRFKNLTDTALRRERERFETVVSHRLFGEPLVAVSPGTLDENKPWYRKWWIYAVGGALIAGGAAGLATYFYLQPKEATLKVNF